MNFSFLENALEYLAVTRGLTAEVQTEVIAALVHAATKVLRPARTRLSGCHDRAGLRADAPTTWFRFVQTEAVCGLHVRSRILGIQLAQAAVVEYYRRHLIRLARDGVAA